MPFSSLALTRCFSHTARSRERWSFRNWQLPPERPPQAEFLTRCWSLVLGLRPTQHSDLWLTPARDLRLSLTSAPGSCLTLALG